MESSMEERQFDAEKVVEFGATLSAIAIAMGTITLSRGPEMFDVRIVPASFLITGVLLIGAAILAMDTLWRQLGLSYAKDLAGVSADDHINLPYSSYLSIVVLNWGLWLLFVTHYVFLFLLAT